MKDFGTKVNLTGGDDSGQSTKYGAKAFNSLSDELEKVVESTGQTLDTSTGDDPNTTQLSRAITEYSLTAQAYVDGGIANAYVLSPINSNFEQPSSYLDGQKIRFKAGNTNTGASTVNVNGIGIKSIVDQSGSALPTGSIAVGQYYDLVYSSSADNFVLSVFDISGKADIDSPTFTGTPLAPTPSIGDDSTKIATTAFVKDVIVGGSGQTWQDVASERSLGVTYTNNTGRSICINIVLLTSGVSQSVIVLVDGITQVGSSIAQSGLSIAGFFIIPNGSTYSVLVGSYSISYWSELR